MNQAWSNILVQKNPECVEVLGYSRSERRPMWLETSEKQEKEENRWKLNYTDI